MASPGKSGMAPDVDDNGGGRKFGLSDSYSNDASPPPTIPDYSPGGQDFYVQTINRSDAEYQMEKAEKDLHDQWCDYDEAGEM